MLKKSMPLVLFLSGITFCSLSINAANTKNDLKKIYRLRTSDTEFVIPEKSGFLRSYRRLNAEPLIDFISLSEEGKAQCSITGLKYEHNWAGHPASIMEGQILYQDNPVKDKNWYSPSPNLQGCVQTVLGCVENKLKFQSNGKLLNEWTQEFSWNEKKLANEEIKTLVINWKREILEIASTGVTVRFPRTIPAKAYVCPDGQFTKLEDSKKIKLGKNSKLFVSFLEQGSLLELSFDVPGTVELRPPLASEKLMGGWSLDFFPEEAESIENLSLQIEDHAYKKYNAGGLEIAANPATGDYSLFLGGMSLFQLYAVENKKEQNIQGEWKTKALEKNKNSYIKSSGKISNNWENICRINNGKASFTFKKENSFQESAGFISIPSEWIGSRFLIRRFSERSEVTGVVPPYASNDFQKNLSEETAISGCPLRIGICLDLGVIPANSVIEWYPTESEKVIFILKENCRIISGKFQETQYNQPFDLTSLPDWIRTIAASKTSGAIDLNMPAFLSISPQDKNTSSISVECFYEKNMNGNVHIGKNVRNDKYSAADTDRISCTEEDGKVIIQTPYWKAVHDKTKGGALTEIIFPEGLNKNILKAPVSSYLKDNTGKLFQSTDSENVNIKIEKKGNDEIKLTIQGTLGKSQLPFTDEYIYDRGGLKRNIEFNFDKNPMKIKTLGVARIETTPLLDYAKYKPCLTRYTNAVFPASPITCGTRMFAGIMGLYRQNGEGIDFSPASDLWEWYVLGENNGYFSIEGNGANPVIIVEALRVNKEINIDKAVSFTHYIGLPEAKCPAPKSWRPAGISDPKWITISDELVDSLRDAGINITTEPIGNPGFGRYYENIPVIFTECSEKLKRNQISPLPFFAPVCFVKGCKEIEENIGDWTMGRVVKGKYEPSWAGTYLMGCYESEGLRNYMEKGFSNIIGKFPNGGIYCDFIYPMGPCYNPSHAKIPHIGMDGLLDFAKWIKKDLLKKDQAFYAHTGYCPAYNIERFCDLAFIWEEINYWYSNDGRPTSLARMSQCGVQSSNIQRVLDPHAIFSWMLRREPLGRIRHLPEDAKAFVTRAALNGLFPILATGSFCPVSAKDLLEKSKDFLKLSKAYKGFQLSDYYFMDWKTQDVIGTDDPYVKAAVYYKNGSTLIVLGIPEDNNAHEFSWKISKNLLEKLGLSGALELENRMTGKSVKVTAAELSSKGIKEKLEGYGLVVIMIKAQN